MSIRFAVAEDLPAMLAIYGPYVEETCVSFEYEAPTLEAFSQRFAAITQQFPWLVWEEEGKLLGYAYASAPFERDAYRWCAEPSIYLAPSAHRRGIGRALYAALEAILEMQGYRLLYAIITADNAVSLAFHEKLGYRHLATFPGCGYKHGACLGVVWMEKSLPFVDYPRDFPAPASKIVKNHKNLAAVLDKISLSTSGKM